VYKLKGNKQLKIDKASQIPDGGTIVNNYYLEDSRWFNWKEVLDKHDAQKDFDPSLTYHELIVPTTENLKHSYMLNLCVKSSIPVLFVGPTGTGKTVSIQKYLRSLPYELYTSVFICFSAKTSANQTQEIIDGKLEKRGRRMMGPPLGKKCVVMIDDLNMPALEKYGA
jgi:dynein heavy chain